MTQDSTNFRHDTMQNKSVTNGDTGKIAVIKNLERHNNQAYPSKRILWQAYSIALATFCKISFLVD